MTIETTRAASSDLHDVMRELTRQPAERVVFWSGAGVSGDAPTSAPLGNALTDRALRDAFEPSLVQALGAAYCSLAIARDRPRLEAVLEVVAAEHGLDVLAALLGDLADAPPNGNHRFFADHVRRGGQHVTANFDTCIERAGGDPGSIVHIHGALSDRGDVASLGARLSRIEQGFARHLRERLDDAIGRASLLVIVGYSGLDYFDVDPYWRDAACRGVFDGKRVAWVDHASGWGDLLLGQSCDRGQLRIFADEGGAEVVEIRGPTREVLNAMAQAWGASAIPQPTGAPPPPLPAVRVSDSARSRATTHFLVAAGLLRTVRSRLAAGELSAAEHGWAASAAWGAGQYEEAAEHWRAANPGDDPLSVAVRREREGACLWLRGRLLAARRLLRRALDDAAHHDVEPRQRLIIAETLVRVLVHMRRLPDTRFLVGSRSMRAALHALDDIERSLLEAADGRRLPVHLRARVTSARANLTGQPVPAVGEGFVRDFGESDALGAMLNYEHAALRRRVEHPRDGDGGPPEPSEYVRLARRFTAVGNTADAARVPLLPGAATAFPLSEVLCRLVRCDVTIYHLARLMTLHVLQRSRQVARLRRVSR